MTANISDVAMEQELLGWDLALEGCVSKKWWQQQEEYWKMFWMCKSSWRWTMELIKKLLGVAWDMWQHQNEALHEHQDNQPKF